MKIRVREVLKVCALLALIAGAIWAFNDTLRELVRGEDRDALVAAALSAQRSSLLSGQKLPVVFVHGINDTGAGWNEMKEQFRALGWNDNLLYANSFSCSGLNEDYATIACSNISNAGEIAGWVNAASAAHGNSQVILVAHSMGGVSSRYFMKNNPAATKVAAFISMASMNNGLPLTCPAAGVKILGFDIGATVCNELSRTGQFIPALWKTSYDGIPSLNFYSSGDKTVSTYAAFVMGACNVVVDNVGHSNINRSTLKDSDKTGVPGIPEIRPALEAFLKGDPYDTFCEQYLVAPSVSQLTTGVKKFLVVPILFEDTDSYEQRTPAQLDAIFGTATQVGTIGKYFREISDSTFQPVFVRSNVVTLPGKLLPATQVTYASFGGVRSARHLSYGTYVSDDSANEIDKALCSVTANGQNIDLAEYDGVVFMYQDTKRRHTDAQSIYSDELEDKRSGGGIYWGLGNVTKVYWYDCDVEDISKPKYSRIVIIYTGGKWQGDHALQTTIAHELFHASGLGHATRQSDEYGNLYDIMGAGIFALSPGGLHTGLTNWFTTPGNMLAINRSGKYELNTIESKQYPTGLSFAYEGVPGSVVLEIHDGADLSAGLVPLAPSQSGLLAVQKENPGTFGGDSFADTNRTRLILESAGLSKGECDVLDLGSRRVVYHYNEDDTVSVKFTDDYDFDDGGFGCGLDLSAESITLNKAPVVGSAVLVTVKVKNAGDKDAVSPYDSYLDFITLNDDITGVDRISGNELDVGEQDDLVFSWVPTVAGDGQLEFSMPKVEGDKNVRNNYIEKRVVVKPAPGQAIPSKSVKQSISITRSGGGGGSVGVRVSSADGKSTQARPACDFTIPCVYEAEIGSKVTLSVTPKAAVAFTKFTGDYCNETVANTCSFTLAGVGSVNVDLVPTATVLLEKEGTGAEWGSIDLIYQEPGKSTPTTCNENCVGKTFTVAAGSSLSAIAVEEQNENQFASWVGCTQSAADKRTCVASAPKVGDELTIKAKFVKLVEHRFVASGEQLGTLRYGVREPGWSIATEQEMPFASFVKKHPEGTAITVKYVPPADLSGSRVRISDWQFDATSCVPNTNSCSITLGAGDESTGLTAKYQYKITVGHDSVNGSVKLTASNPNQGPINCAASNTSPLCAQGWYWKGSNLAIEAVPNSGYTFGGWALDCGGPTGGIGYMCYKNGITGGANIRAAAFPVHKYEFYIGRDCDSSGSGRLLEPGQAYCGQGDISVTFGSAPTLYSRWTDYMYQRHQQVSGTDLWEVDFFPQSDSWLEYWSCGVNSPYRCILEGGGLDVNKDGFVDVYVKDSDGKSAWSRINQFSLTFGFRSDYDVALGTGTSQPAIARNISYEEVVANTETVTFRAQQIDAPATILREWDAISERDLLGTAVASVVQSIWPLWDSVETDTESMVSYESPHPRLVWVGRDADKSVTSIFAKLGVSIRSAFENSVSSIAGLLSGWSSTNLAAVGDLNSPDLVARSLYVNDCAEECVVAPGEPVYLTAIVTNESFVATTQALGTRLTIHKQGDLPQNDLILYRYHWDGIGAQDGVIAVWRNDWIPSVGVYELKQEVDDWNNVDSNNTNDVLTITVTVSDAPVVLNTGVRDAFGGSISISGDAIESAICTAATCVASPVLGSKIQLNAIAQANRELVRWEGKRAGDCVIYNYATSTCEVLMNNAKDITAYFETIGPKLTVSVDNQNGGSGKVSSTNTGGARNFAKCSGTCVKPFVTGSSVALTATPDAGSYFSEWRGADAERCVISSGGKVCTITVKDGEGAEVSPLFKPGSIPKQSLIIRSYSDSDEVNGGSVQVRDPLNGDALLYTCSSDVCTYTLDTPQVSGRPLKIVPVPNSGFSFSQYVSPLVDLTQDGRISEAGCGSFDDDTRRLTDADTTTWYTCGGNGRVVYSAQGVQLINQVELYLPSISRAIDVGAYEKTIKRAIGEWGGLSPDDPSLEYNASGLSRVVDDILQSRYTSSNNQHLIVRTGALPRRPGINQANISMYTHAPGDVVLSVDGRLNIDVRSGTAADTGLDISLPGPAYPDTELGNILVQQYLNNTYKTISTLTEKGDVTATVSGTPANSISFRSDHAGKPIRIGEIKLMGTYRDPCSSQSGGACSVSLLQNVATVVPVSFTKTGGAAVLGDVNSDGKVTASDALMALRLAVGQIVSNANATAADISCDNRVAASDALAILQAAVGTRILEACVSPANIEGIGEIIVDQIGGTGEIQVAGLSQAAGEYSLSFTATGDSDARVIGWIGDCAGSGDVCTLTTQGTKSLTALAVYMSQDAVSLTRAVDPGTMRNGDILAAELHDDTGVGTFDPPPEEPEISDPLPPAPEEPDISDPLPPAPDEPDISDPLPPAPEEPEISDPLPPVVTPPPNTAVSNLYVAGIRLSPPSPQIRKTVDVNATIGNAGRAKTSGTFNATLRIDQGNDGTWDASKVVRLQTLAGGATVPVTFKKAFRPSGPNVRIQVCVDDLALPTTENFGIIRIPEYFPGAVSETTKSDNCNVMLVNAAERGGGPAAAILSGILIPMYAGPALLVVVLLGGSYLYVRRRKIDVT